MQSRPWILLLPVEDSALSAESIPMSDPVLESFIEQYITAQQT